MRARHTPGLDEPGLVETMLELSRRRGVVVVIMSGVYAKSSGGRAELAWILQNLGMARIFPISLDRVSEVSTDLRSAQSIDFSDFAFVGEGFSKSERYVDFQARIRELAYRVFESIEKLDREVSARPSAGEQSR